jgi:hypothetical protein
MNGRDVDFIIGKTFWPMLMGERANRRDLKKILDELRGGKLICEDTTYTFIGLTNESAQDLVVESGKTLVDVYSDRKLQVLYPLAPGLILRNQTNGTIELFVVEKRLRFYNI